MTTVDSTYNLVLSHPRFRIECKLLIVVVMFACGRKQQIQKHLLLAMFTPVDFKVTVFDAVDDMQTIPVIERK
jgi:hypothetical protein